MGECCPFENFYICKLFVIGEDGDTTCAFSRGCCEVNGTAVNAVSGGLPHSRSLRLKLPNYSFTVKGDNSLFFSVNIDSW
jgi:hypothetical protein